MFTRTLSVSLRFIRTGFLCLLCLPTLALAIDEKDLEHQLLPKAIAGDVEAQYNLGLLYSVSNSIKMLRPRDAEHWLRSAAEKNHLGATLSLIDLYSDHSELIADDGDIAGWLERAATLGHTRSAVRLGTLLWNGGRGLKQDRARGYRLLRTGALRGDEPAVLILTARALDGMGVKRDPAKARQILAFGAANGILRARQENKVLPENTRRLTPPGEIFSHLEKLSNSGDADAMLLFALTQQTDPDFLLLHEDLDQDVVSGHAELRMDYTRPKSQGWFERSTTARLARARVWLEKAAALGQPEAITRLGIIYANGQGVPVDSPRAVELFERAAKTGHALAQLNLAVMILDGKLPAVDPARAVSLLTAASTTNTNAAFELGMIYYEGRLQPRDVPRAAGLFEQAARRGQESALINLGVIAINGENGPADPDAAHKWWMLAQVAGSRKAADLLRRSASRYTAEQRAASVQLIRAWQESVLRDRAAELPELELE